MKKYEGITLRLAILAVLLILSAVLAFVEIGVSTAFDITYEGLSYLEYTHQFYSVEWHLYGAVMMLVIVFTIATEVTYRQLRTMIKE